MLQEREHEVFGQLLLDNQHRVLAFEELFRGTLAGANVYPREVVKRGLAVNCGAIIVVHNHLSGNPEPSSADIALTKSLREALTLVDIRLLDHLVVGTEGGGTGRTGDDVTRRLPTPYSLEETLGKLRHSLTTASNQGALVLLEKAVTKAHADAVYAKQFDAALLQGSTVEIRECLSCFGDYFERSRDAPPYYPHTMIRISRHNPQGHLTAGGLLHFKELCPCLPS